MKPDNSLPFDVSRASLAVQEHYRDMIEQGVGPKMAEMLALQSPPGLNIGRGYEQNREGYKEFDRLPKPVADARRARHKRLTGREMPTSGWYDEQLAAFPGDPRAHVKSADEAKAVAKARGLNLEGPLSVVNDHGAEPPKKKRGLAPDIVHRRIDEMTRKDHSLKLKSHNELREMVIAKHAPQESK